jgi:hypothetical protein
MENQIKYLRACQLIKSGVDFILLSQVLGISIQQATELMIQDEVYEKYFQTKKDNLVESES